MSKAQFTMKAREEIVRDHMGKFDGVFRAEQFVEVAKAPDHPAHEWFDWDKEGAAYKYWLHQARLFSSVKIKVASLEPVGGWKKTEVEPIMVEITKTLPLLVSPVGGRSRRRRLRLRHLRGRQRPPVVARRSGADAVAVAAAFQRHPHRSGVQAGPASISCYSPSREGQRRGRGISIR